MSGTTYQNVKLIALLDCIDIASVTAEMKCGFQGEHSDSVPA